MNISKFDKLKTMSLELEAVIEANENLNSKITLVPSQILSDVRVPRKQSIQEDTMIKLENIKKKQNQYLEYIQKKIDEINEELKKIKDDEVRLIITYRIQGLTYEQIGDKLGYSESGVRMKVERYEEV